MKLKKIFLIVAASVACGMTLQAPAADRGPADRGPADPNKVLRYAIEAPDDGFNIARVNSFYSKTLAEAVFEPMLAYDYLARPAKLVPNTLEALPEASDDGKTYTFKIKKGIYFTPDPAFKGQKRELTAADYAFVIKRHMNPQVRSVQEGDYRGKIVGLDALAEQAKKTGKFDYDAPVHGLEVVDRYTLRIRLNTPDHNILYQLTDPGSGALAREVVEYYGEDALGRHPVGTGAYMLKDYVPQSKIVFVANPDYRGFTWDFKSAGNPGDEAIVRAMKGKQMPQIGRVEVYIMEEEQARWLAFDSGQIDYFELSPPATPKLLDGDKLKAEIAAKGVTLTRFADVGYRYTFFNMKDPVVGGYTKDKIALRRALAMAYNYADDASQVWHGQAVRARSMVPPGVAGHDPNYRSSIGYDPDLANKLLDHFGYKVGPDGWRTMPDGKPLVIKIHSVARARERAKMEIWKRSLDRIKVKAEFPVSNFADNQKAAVRCELQVWGLGNLLVSVPDGIDGLRAFYGPNAYSENYGCYQSKAFDQLFEKAMSLPAGPERHALYQQMERQLEADTAVMVELWQIRNWVSQPWVKGFKRHPNIRAEWKYLDIEKK
ncbi:MAG TPA: ABC transporter substrate-binding protein [Paucimonas sp.]|nr:ABC transporter substrate-binding protein [Paucimonas sp.]